VRLVTLNIRVEAIDVIIARFLQHGWLPLNPDFHCAHRNFSSGTMDSRFLRAVGRLFIGRRKPTPHTPHLLASMGVTSWKYGGSQTSQTPPGRGHQSFGK
jgi:hypothetical protein